MSELVVYPLVHNTDYFYSRLRFPKYYLIYLCLSTVIVGEFCSLASPIYGFPDDRVRSKSKCISGVFR